MSSRLQEALTQRKNLRLEMNQKISEVMQDYEDRIKILNRIIDEENRRGIGKQIKKFNKR